MLDLAYVVAVHDEIIAEFGGLPGLAAGGAGGVQAALNRIEDHVYYGGLNDVFGIAALYAVAIAKGHVFNDANKRTGLTCALTYLDRQGFNIPPSPVLEEIMVDVAEGTLNHSDLADILSTLYTDANL